MGGGSARFSLYLSPLTLLPPHPPHPTPPQVRKSEKDPEWDYDPALARRNIHVKRFVDVPMADVEMIFPNKSIWLKPLLLIQLVVTIVGGIIAAIASLQSESGVSPKLMLAALTLVGGRAAAVYSQAAAARQAVADAITRRLYDSTLGAQEADILLLLDEMADQHTKEAFLSYFMLLAKGGGLTKDGLDGAVERYLARTYNETIDFALERALPALLRDGLIEQERGTVKLRAAPLSHAARALADRWAASLDPAGLTDDGGSALAMLTGGGKAAATMAGGAVGAVGAAGANVFTGLGRGLGLAKEPVSAPAEEARPVKSAKPFKGLFKTKKAE